MGAGPQLGQLVADINAFPSSREALQKLKQLQFVPRHAVAGDLPEVMHCIKGMLQQATSGSVRNIPVYLFTVSKVAKEHPPVLRALQGDSYKRTVTGMFQACAADEAVYKRPVAVSQLCSAQYNLAMYCQEFWQTVSEKHIASWDAQAASNVVYAYGKLSQLEVAPAAPARLRQLLQATVRVADSMNAQNVANSLWAFATLGLELGPAPEPLMQALSLIHI